MKQTRRRPLIALGWITLLPLVIDTQATPDANAARAPSSLNPTPEVDSMTTSDSAETAATPSPAPLDGATLAQARQLVMFEAEDCRACKQFKAEVLDHWQSPVPIARSLSFSAPLGWTLDRPLFVTPTLVLFENGREVSRYTGYEGDAMRFWAWLGGQILTPEQRRIAFEQGTERAFTGSLLDEKRPGTFVDPITGAPLFRSETKFESGSGWPSFFDPIEGAVTYHEDLSHGMRRVEVR
jgi:Conserved domain frequently associated with peptide methionine sulfoxide reductase